MCQKAALDPYGLINKYFNKLFDLVLDAARSESKVCLRNHAPVAGADFVQYGFPEASYSVVTTLCFVSPASVLPRIVKQLQDDLDPASLNALSDFDLGVWATPEGTTFVDGYFFVFQWFIIALNLKPFYFIQCYRRRGKLDLIRVEIMRLPNGKKRLESLLRRRKRQRSPCPSNSKL